MDEIDQPFERRRNMGQRNSNGQTRSDRVALALSRATTVREAGDIAVELGAPRGYIDKILEAPVRNQIRLMGIHKAARRFARLREAKRLSARRRLVCSKATGKVFKRSHRP